jgi:hypothetical protein
LEDEKKSLGFLKQGFIKKKKQKNIGGQKKKRVSKKEKKQGSLGDSL